MPKVNENLAKDEKNNFPPVGEAENGQKLIQFLERRLNLPVNLLHRWVRTGQVRINARRCKPFDRIKTDDVIRVPPFAGIIALEKACYQISAAPPINQDKTNFTNISGQLPPLLGIEGNIWAFNKPAGLAVQPESNQDSITSILRRHYADLYFKPAPAHRLDKYTSGVLLVGSTFDALRNLQENFLHGKIHKEYLAWVKGEWPDKEERFLHNYLCKHKDCHPDRITVNETCTSDSVEARCVVRPLFITPEKSLLQILLLTGRKHQIRVQLAHTGYPIIGDNKYGYKMDNLPLKLHSMRIILPEGREFSCLPGWTDNFAVTTLPLPIICDKDNFK